MKPQVDRAELDGLFRRGAISRAQFVVGLVGLGVSSSALELILGTDTGAAQSQIQNAEYMVLIVLDGFRPDYLNLAAMPNLRALLRAGITYHRA